MDKTLTFSGKEFFNDNAAVYILTRGTTYLYIGHTENIYLRFSVHDKFSRDVIQDTDQIQLIFCTDKTHACQVERMLIALHKPLWNGKQGRGGKGTRKILAKSFRDREDSKALDRVLEGVGIKEERDTIDFRVVDKYLRGIKS